MSASDFIDAVMLFGDSLTQTCGPGSLFQRMASQYERKLDVINRGFSGGSNAPTVLISGYTTKWGIPVFEKAFALVQAQKTGQSQKVRLLTIWLGANDSVNPGEAQHVPLADYKRNLHHLVRLVKDPKSPYYSPKTNIVMITPPPIIGALQQNRNPAVTKQYVEGCLEVAKDENVPIVNLYAAILEAAGGSSEQQLGAYLYDGLHFTPEGYAVLVDKLVEVIKQHYPELDSDQMNEPMANYADLAGLA